MDAVFRLADRVSVLVSGRIIATGTPDEIRAHPEVRRAYLATTPWWTTDMAALLEIEQLTAGYGATQVLFGIDLAVGRARGDDAARP